MFLTAFATCVLTLATLGPLWPLPDVQVNTGLETLSFIHTCYVLLILYVYKRYNVNY